MSDCFCGTLGYLAFNRPLHDGVVLASRADDMRICCQETHRGYMGAVASGDIGCGLEIWLGTSRF